MTDFLLQHPGQIPLNFTIPGESAVSQITFDILDQQTKFMVNYCIIHGCSVAVCISFLALLLLFIKNKSTPIFILNQIILVVSMIRSSLFLAYQLGPLGSLTYAFTGVLLEDQLGYYKISIAANAAVIMLVFLIQLSFAYQIYVIFRSPEVKIFGRLLTGLSITFLFVTFGFYINSAVESTKQYKMFYTQSPKPYYIDSWVNGLPPILFSASVIFMSLILVVKLVNAIRTRRFLGLRQFLSYHILLIMFTQTLIIPAVLTILAYAFYIFNDIFIHISTCLTVLLLPFTSIWSSLANNSRSFPGSISSYLVNGSDLSNTTSRTSKGDDNTLHEDTFAFFPEKLPKSSVVSVKSEESLDNDTSSFGFKDTTFELSSKPELPSDIMDILRDGEDENSFKHFSTRF